MKPTQEEWDKTKKEGMKLFLSIEQLLVTGACFSYALNLPFFKVVIFIMGFNGILNSIKRPVKTP